MGLTVPLRTTHVIPLLIAVCFLGSPAQAQYAGGSGTSKDPYLIATIQDVLDLSDSTADWNRRFKLTADIDLSGVHWTDAVIQNFEGGFHGDGHLIRNLSITGPGRLGLFGILGAGVQPKNSVLLIPARLT